MAKIGGHRNILSQKKCQFDDKKIFYGISVIFRVNKSRHTEG